MIVPLTVLLLSFTSVSDVTTWYERYDQGVRAIDEGHAVEALRELEAAVALNPEPGLKVRTEGPRYVDYTPYLYLAVAAHMAGKVDRAREWLERAEAAGVAAQTEEGRELLEAYRILLKAEPPPDLGEEAPSTADHSPRPLYADYERKPVVLSDEEYRELQERVLTRCGLDVGSKPQQAPWYYYYELGLELAEHNDPQRALDALVEAAERRPDPRHGARLYGMWFVDYLPYFEIAKQHTILGNRECATDALKISIKRGEILPDNKSYEEFLTLREELEVQ